MCGSDNQLSPAWDARQGEGVEYAGLRGVCSPMRGGHARRVASPTTFLAAVTSSESCGSRQVGRWPQDSAHRCPPAHGRWRCGLRRSRGLDDAFRPLVQHLEDERQRIFERLWERSQIAEPSKATVRSCAGVQRVRASPRRHFSSGAPGTAGAEKSAVRSRASIGTMGASPPTHRTDA